MTCSCVVLNVSWSSNITAGHRAIPISKWECKVSQVVSFKSNCKVGVRSSAVKCLSWYAWVSLSTEKLLATVYLNCAYKNLTKDTLLVSMKTETREGVYFLSRIFQYLYNWTSALNLESWPYHWLNTGMADSGRIRIFKELERCSNTGSYIFHLRRIVFTPTFLNYQTKSDQMQTTNGCGSLPQTTNYQSWGGRG